MEVSPERIRRISPEQLMALGLNDLAYLKPVEIDGNPAIAVFSADGRQIAIMPDRRQAAAMAWQNGLAPVTLQ